MKPSILVTGGAGYIGSHAVLELLPHFAVTIIDNLSRGHRELVPTGAVFLCADLRSQEQLQAVFGTRHFDAILHFAAYAYVGESMQEPGLYFENNVSGAINLLNAAVAAGVRQLVFSSTCAVYGIPATTPITETHSIAPINPYGESKAIIERMLHWYARQHGLRSVVLRYFNAAGADAQARSGELHHPEPHLIPNILRTAAGFQSELQIFGTDYPTPDGTAVRDYIHVTDLAEAHHAALRYLLTGGTDIVFNLGTGCGISVLEMIREAERVAGHRVAFAPAPRRPGDPPVLVADGKRAKQVLGWHPSRSDPESILASAWRWHQKT